jgi:hypothetical protein
MLKKSKIISIPLAISVAAIVFLGSLNSCGGSSTDSKQSSDSTKTAGETKSTSDVGGAKKYEIKSGIVYYKPIEFMKGMKSQETMYFDDYGKKEAKETLAEANMMGISSKTRTVSIIDGDYSITYTIEKIENGKDVTEKIAKRTKLTEQMKTVVNMAAMFSDMKKMKDEYDYKDEGTETVAGLTGKKFSMSMDKNKSNRITVVMYKNILLKTEMMKIKIEVDKINENANIPADKFTVPAGYKIEDVDMNSMGK